MIAASDENRAVPINAIDQEAGIVGRKIDAASLMLGYALGREPRLMTDPEGIKRLTRHILETFPRD